MSLNYSIEIQEVALISPDISTEGKSILSFFKKFFRIYLNKSEILYI